VWSARLPSATGAGGQATPVGCSREAYFVAAKRPVLGQPAPGELLVISLVDISLRNPIANLAADSGFLRLLPAYGAMQAATTAGFLPVIPVADLLLQLAWFAGLACLARVEPARRKLLAAAGLSGEAGRP
jgi:hypothetical protein